MRLFLICIFLLGCSSNNNKIADKGVPFVDIDAKKENNLESFQAKLLKEHNMYRSQKKLQPLKADKKLCEYAQKHAEFMSKKSSLSHSSMSDLGNVLNNGYVGENIAWGQEDEKQVVNVWMWSPGHRMNILNDKYKNVGFGMKEDSKGRKYWCVVFSN